MMTAKTVVIIGAGPSGLAAAKVLLEDGFDVTIFDRQTTLGGIWSPDWAYAELHTQQLAGFMEFSDLRDPFARDNAPWQEIHDYLSRYAKKFNLVERIRLQTTVLSVDKSDLKNSALPWIIEVRNANGQFETFQFGFVVVASGLFSTANMPTFRGQDKFAGSIMHANQIKNSEQLRNKRVIVVGGGKTALDLASVAGKYARSCHLIFRRSHWLVPEAPFNGYIPSEYVFSRFMTAIFDPFPYAPHSSLFYFLRRHLSSVISKIFDNMSKGIIATFKPVFYMNEQMIPEGSFRTAENSVRMTEEFIRLNQEGRIVRKLASIDDIIDRTTIHLDSGDFLQADMIVCATGYVEQFVFLSPSFHQALGQECSTKGVDLDLYRRIVPIGVPNVAFIGLPASLNTWAFFEVQCHWMSDYFLGRIQLPKTEKEMLDEVQTTREFIWKLFHRKSYYFQYYWLEPIEIYLRDMGVALHRTNNWLSEYFGVYRPNRLANLHAERHQNARETQSHIWHSHWYFSFTHTIVLLFIFGLVIRFCF